MKRIVITILLAALLIVMTGMGLRQESKIPIPVKRYQAVIFDQADVRTQVSSLSVEGDTFFTSRHGRGTIFIDFKDIRHISFEPSMERDVSISIQMKNADAINGLVNGNSSLFGVAPFGNFKVKVRDIKRIDFLDEEADSKEDKEQKEQLSE